MRSEHEMMDIILATAKHDTRIRAVIMNGSRANPTIKKDIFQDFDIVYRVRDIESFTSDHSWIDRFGKRIMMQMPEADVIPRDEHSGHVVYLMQFMDGNRLDLTLMPLEKIDKRMKPDSLSILLLDKDGIIEPFPPSNDSDYHIRRPSEKEFLDNCNEFWWICLNISKGLWREELTYVMFMYEQINRNMIIQMLEWRIGIKTNFARSAGKFGKNFKELLNEQEWNEFEETYTDSNFEHIWTSLFNMCDLYRKTAIHVARELKFEYPFDDDHHVTTHLMHVRQLPKNALEVY